MYNSLLVLHNALRWLVLVCLIFTILKALVGYRNGASLSVWDNRLRHWTATVAHIQLLVGVILFAKSPVATYFWSAGESRWDHPEFFFYGFIHVFCMVTAIVVLTIGSALAKRKAADQEKFRTILLWYSISLLIIFAAIPWPFSPISHRPYFRGI